VLCLRVRRLYFALITLGFSQLFATIAQKWSSLTLGENGIFGQMIPSWLARPVTGHLFLAGVSLLSIAALWKVVHSPFGMSLRAVRENRERAEALGVNTALVQWQAFVISGTFCSVAGALVVITQQGAYPQLFDWVQSGVPVIAAVVGGMMVFAGPVLGALVYQYGHDWTVQYTEHWQVVLGLILLAIVLVAPDGLVGLLARAGKGLGRLGALRGGRRRVGGSSA
jgi:branched-chain amino acid transport system permease protein